MKKISAILVAGGVGTRMNSDLPKQFLLLNQKPIARYSFDLLLSFPDIHELIVICAPEYRHFFQDTHTEKRVDFALPGKRRQDSVYHGLEIVNSSSEFVLVHDSARPCIDVHCIQRVIDAAILHGAATLGMPVKFTVKESDGNQFVSRTPDRSFVWEIQTPQVIALPALKDAFAHAIAHNLTVTDDVSLVEILNMPVKLVEGLPLNLKITIPEDLAIAENFIKSITPIA